MTEEELHVRMTHFSFRAAVVAGRLRRGEYAKGAAQAVLNLLDNQALNRAMTEIENALNWRNRP